MGTKKHKPTGTTAMKASGKKLVGVWFWPEQVESLRQAASIRRMTVARFIRNAALAEAVNVKIEASQAESPVPASKRKK